MDLSSSSPLAVFARHDQNMSAGGTMKPHWGYNDEAVPCTGDAGTCAYLDLVYSAHDYAMLYMGIMWAVAGGILFIWALSRRCWPSPRKDEATAAMALRVDDGKVLEVSRPSVSNTRVRRFTRAFASLSRTHLLPDSPVRAIFGRTTRLQVLILAVLIAYLTVFSFAGMTYQYWITPAKKAAPGLFTIRSTLGPWSNRVGILAYALTPFSVLLASRESLLSLLTGAPYQSFNFLHRWLGYIIFAQSLLHTIGWIIIEVKLYQPQPFVPVDLFSQLYMHWGILAMFFILCIFILSLPWVIRLTGYEFFRKAHYVLAMVFMGACYGHWDKLSCFMIPGLVLWFVDRLVRLIRTGLMHYQLLPTGKMGFTASQATVTHFPDAENGDVVRLDLRNSQDVWKIGQHYYLCFAESSIWQSHPFTPLNVPEVRAGSVEHSYIFRAKKGETKKITELAARKLSENPTGPAVTPVILTGAYGEHITENLTPDVNVLAIAGGTGITYVLPVILDLIRQPCSRDRKVELVWAVRRKADLEWVGKELSRIRKAASSHGVTLRIFITRDGKPERTVEGGEKDTSVVTASLPAASSSSASGASSLDISSADGDVGDRHPDLKSIVGAFVADTVRGPTTVYASGPGALISDLRAAVASCNGGAQVWKGNDRFDVRLVCDDRLEW